MPAKDTMIFIPEIPVEWTQRQRSGHTNIWNGADRETKLPETRLEPPEKGLYAERFPDANPAGWYWVNGCNKCLGISEKYSYIVCHEHDRCETCGTHREDLTDGIPWGTPDGFQCRTCHNNEHEKQKQEALAHAEEIGHSEIDCHDEDKIICPKCASEYPSDDIHEPGTHQLTCGVCDIDFELELEYEPKYTTTLKTQA